MKELTNYLEIIRTAFEFKMIGIEWHTITWYNMQGIVFIYIALNLDMRALENRIKNKIVISFPQRGFYLKTKKITIND